MDFLVGFFGTFNRTQWWMAQLLAIPVTVLCLILAFMLYFISPAIGLLAICGAYLLSFIISTAATAKRFRERGKSGLWSLILFLPLGFVWIIIECGFLPGNGTSYTINSSNYDGPVSGEVQDFSQEAPKTQTTSLGMQNFAAETNGPKPLFGA